MANHKSATKRHLQSLKKRTRNRAVKSALAGIIKTTRIEITEKKATPNAGPVQLAVNALAVAAKKGVIHKNAAKRRISRLMRQANASVSAK